MMFHAVHDLSCHGGYKGRWFMTWGLHVGLCFVLASCCVMVGMSWGSFYRLCRLSYQIGHVHVAFFMPWGFSCHMYTLVSIVLAMVSPEVFLV